MRVLYVINSLGAGGAEQSLAEMLPRFREHGIIVSLVCLRKKQESVRSSVVQQGFDVRFISASSLPGRVTELRRRIQAESPDLVHTTLIEANIIGRLAALGTSVPVLTSLVNTSYDEVRYADPNVTPWKLRLVQAIDGWTARHMTHHFHAITRAVKQSNVHALGIDPDRVTVIERGRDVGRMGQPSAERRRRVRGQLGIGESDDVVINVGRQEYQKGQRYLLEAMEALIPSRPRLKLLIAGRKGHATSELEKMVEQSPALQERVRFLGHRGDVPDLLAAADIFVFPSLYEGLGGAVIEAMALGLPIVASDVPAVREVTEAGKNALLVPPAIPETLATAIEALLNAPGRCDAFGQYSRQLYEARFTLDSVVERMAGMYRQVAEARIPESAPVA